MGFIFYGPSGCTSRCPVPFPKKPAIAQLCSLQYTRSDCRSDDHSTVPAFKSSASLSSAPILQSCSRLRRYPRGSSRPISPVRYRHPQFLFGPAARLPPNSSFLHRRSQIHPVLPPWRVLERELHLLPVQEPLLHRGRSLRVRSNRRFELLSWVNASGNVVLNQTAQISSFERRFRQLGQLAAING